MSRASWDAALRRALAAVVLLLSGCPAGSRRQAAAWESLGREDLAVFREALLEDEVARHPELAQATRYRLALKVADSLTEVTGRLRVRYTNRGHKPLAAIPFFLFPNLTTGALEVQSVQAGGVDLPTQLERQGSLLEVTLPAPLAPGQDTEVSLQYRLRVPSSEEGESEGFALGGGVLSLAYAYPIIPAEPSTAAERPMPVPYGDFQFAEASFYLVALDYPGNLVLAAPGAELDRRRAGARVQVLVALGPARDFYLALGRDLVSQTARRGAVEVRSYAPKGAEEGSRLALGTAVSALKDFEHRFGPYPYRRLTLVSVPFSSLGLEFPGLVMVARRLYDLGRSYDGIPARVLLEATTAHEIAHQWFYAMVGSDQLLEPWIDESAAQYATWLYYRDRYGESAAQGFLDSLEQRWARVGRAEIPLGRPVRAYSPREYSAIIYGRGPLFLRALSERMGEEHFDSFLRELCARYEWQLVTGSEVLAAAEASCSCELDDLWAQWVGTPESQAARN
jgi:hypothetical protein